tara:strand:- start:1195 stop:1512 length:318 start_codon:yes stop_codon:yes gene_type:complete
MTCTRQGKAYDCPILTRARGGIPTRPATELCDAIWPEITCDARPPLARQWLGLLSGFDGRMSRAISMVLGPPPGLADELRAHAAWRVSLGVCPPSEPMEKIPCCS